MSELLIPKSQIKDALSGEGVEEIEVQTAKPGDVLVHITEFSDSQMIRIFSVAELEGTCVTHGACQTVYNCCRPELGTASQIEIIPDASPFDRDRYNLSQQLMGIDARYRLLRILSPELLAFSSGEFSLPLLDIEFEGSTIDELRNYLETSLEPIRREWTALLARERVDMSEQGLTFSFSFDNFSSDNHPRFVDKMAASFGMLCNAYAFGQCQHGNIGPNSFNVRLNLRNGYEEKTEQALDRMLHLLIKTFKDTFGITVTVEKHTDYSEYIMS